MNTCSPAAKALGALTVILPGIAFGTTCLAAHLLKVAIVVSGVFAAAPALLSMASGTLFFALVSNDKISLNLARAGHFGVSLLISAIAIAAGLFLGHVGPGIAIIISIVGMITAFGGSEAIRLFAKNESFFS